MDISYFTQNNKLMHWFEYLFVRKPWHLALLKSVADCTNHNLKPQISDIWKNNLSFLTPIIFLHKPQLHHGSILTVYCFS